MQTHLNVTLYKFLKLCIHFPYNKVLMITQLFQQLNELAGKIF